MKLKIMDIRRDRAKLELLTKLAWGLKETHGQYGIATDKDILGLAKRLGCTFAAARSLVKWTFQVGTIRPYIPRQPKIVTSTTQITSNSSSAMQNIVN